MKYIAVKPMANHFVAVGIRNTVFYFSYDILIAVYYSKNKLLIVSNAYHSQTTQKHLNKVQEIHRNDSLYNYTQDEVNELNNENRIT